jgi:hypothetical protein
MGRTREKLKAAKLRAANQGMGIRRIQSDGAVDSI